MIKMITRSVLVLGVNFFVFNERIIRPSSKKRNGNVFLRLNTKKLTAKTKRLRVYLSLFLACCFSLYAVTGFAAKEKPLPASQAFIFSLLFDQSKTLIAKWDIAPHYYLYRKRLRIELSPKTNDAKIEFPTPTVKQDFTGTSYEVYAGHLSIPIHVKANTKVFRLSVDYQGCSSDGFCYPFTHKEMQVNLENYSITEMIQEKEKPPLQTSVTSLLSNQNGVESLLNNKHLVVLWLIFAGIGLLLSFTPCVLPMIPILLSIIVQQKETVNTKNAFLLSLSYVLGGAITYALAGLLAAELGSSLQVWLQKPFIILFVSALFFLLSLSLFGFYELSIPRALQNRLTEFSNQQKSGQYAGVFMMGMISTLVLSPCVTAPLVGVLMYVGQTGNILLAMSVLFVMGFSMGVPLLLIGTGFGKWLPKSGPWMGKVKFLFGLIMLSLAVSLASRAISISGIRSWFGTKEITNINHSFILVHDIDEFNKKLMLAETLKKPVILDFYADWCESCILMDKNVFAKPNIKQALNKYILLRADLSANTSKDEALLKYFKVIAPPTVLFFDQSGKELNEKRIVGEVNEKEFLARV